MTIDTRWRAFGAGRLVYGSNRPVCERAGPCAAAAAKYFGANAAHSYRWPGAEAAAAV